MIKGLSLMLIGIGLFVSAALSISESYVVLFSVDNSLRLEMSTMTQAAFDSFVVENEYNDAAFGLLSGLLQIKASIILLIIGGFLYLKEQKKPKQIEEKHRVSIVWQITGSFIPGFDLWVMSRIGKIKHGAIVFSIQYILFIALFFTDVEDYFEIGISLLIAIGYAIVVYIWSKEWNEQISENKTNDETKRFGLFPMAKKESVNVNWQTVLAIIPYVQFYASYQVEKLRQFFLLWVVIGVSVAVFNFFAGERIPYMSFAVGIPIYVILIRKWSKKWNEQISKRILNVNSEDDFSSRTALG